MTPLLANTIEFISDRPSDAAALNNLAWLYQQKGDLPKARQLAERAIGAAPRRRRSMTLWGGFVGPR